MQIEEQEQPQSGKTKDKNWGGLRLWFIIDTCLIYGYRHY